MVRLNLSRVNRYPSRDEPGKGIIEVCTNSADLLPGLSSRLTPRTQQVVARSRSWVPLRIRLLDRVHPQAQFQVAR